MSNYEDSMRAKFRGEDIYNLDAPIENDEAIDEYNIDEENEIESENEEFEITEDNIDEENIFSEEQNQFNYTNTNLWDNVDINKVSEMKTFLASDTMFDLSGAGIGLIMVIVAIFNMLNLGFEKIYLWFGITGLALIVVFIIKNKRRKSNSSNKKTKKLFKHKDV
jgi:hypothetical protein